MKILLAALSLMSGAVSAQEAPPAGEGQAGDMHVVQVTVVDVGVFGEQYRARRPNGFPDSAAHASLSDTILTTIFFDRCQAGGNGMCDLTGVLRLIDPQGDAGAPQDVIFWRFPPPRAGEHMMAQSMSAIRLGAGRGPGAYRVRLTVRDNVAGREVTTERALTIGDAP